MSTPMPESEYPNWDARYDALRDQTEREIEDWYKANADRSGHAPGGPVPHEGFMGRLAGEVDTLYEDVVWKLKQMFHVGSEDTATTTEYDRAFGDEPYVKGRIQSTTEDMYRDGRLK